MKRSEFVAQFAQHGEAAARAAEQAGATWEAEGLELPLQARVALANALAEFRDENRYSLATRDQDVLHQAISARLAPLWPPAQPEPAGGRYEVAKNRHGYMDTLLCNGRTLAHIYPGNQHHIPAMLAALNREPAGELRPRKLAAPLRLEQGDDDLLHLYDATGREILWTGGLSEDETDIFRELVKHYNDAPSAWPAPRRAVPGDQASQPPIGAHLLWNEATGQWDYGWRRSLEHHRDCHWLPQPPPPPGEG